MDLLNSIEMQRLDTGHETGLCFLTKCVLCFLIPLTVYLLTPLYVLYEIVLFSYQYYLERMT